MPFGFDVQSNLNMLGYHDVLGFFFFFNMDLGSKNKILKIQ
jgi:hypothetical protein